MNNRIFIVAHAPLAQALKACAMHVYPECAAEVLALDVKADDTPEQSLQVAQQLWAGVPKGDVLVLTEALPRRRHRACTAPSPACCYRRRGRSASSPRFSLLVHAGCDRPQEVDGVK
jgi:hypothetical protein